jgi:hypothetical protein
MKHRRGFARSWWSAGAVVWALAASPAAALTMPTNDPSALGEGYACLTTASSCPAAKQFDLVAPAHVTGTLTFTPTSGSLGTMSILLSVPTFTLERVGGAGAVETIVFTGVTVSIGGWSAFNSGSTIMNLSTGTGTVAGTYEQLDGSAMTVAGPTPFTDTSVSFGNLVCPSTGFGLCGVQIGFFGNWVLPVEGTPHEFVATFNAIVPEPATGALLGAGLVLLGLRRRSR